MSTTAVPTSNVGIVAACAVAGASSAAAVSTVAASRGMSRKRREAPELARRGLADALGGDLGDRRCEHVPNDRGPEAPCHRPPDLIDLIPRDEICSRLLGGADRADRRGAAGAPRGGPPR